MSMKRKSTCRLKTARENVNEQGGPSCKTVTTRSTWSSSVVDPGLLAGVWAAGWMAAGHEATIDLALNRMPVRRSSEASIDERHERTSFAVTRCQRRYP